MEPQRRQAILVVGEMGQGKSSFVKMLVPVELRDAIRVGGYGGSTTIQIKQYPLSDEIRQQLGLQSPHSISVIDTPGLNTNIQNIDITMMKIGGFIIQKKLEIIGIFYCVKALNTIFDQNGRSNYATFHKMLELPKSMKDQISYLLITNYDQCYTKTTGLKNFQNGLKTKLKQNKINGWKEFIPWINQPKDDKELFEEIKNDTAPQKLLGIYRDQWKTLRSVLNKGLKCWNKYFKFEQILELNKQFQQIERQKLSQLLAQLQDIGSTTLLIELNIEITSQMEQQFHGFGAFGNMGLIAVGAVGGALVWFANNPGPGAIARIAGVVGVEGVEGVEGVKIIGGVILLAAVGLFIYSTYKYFTKNKQIKKEELTSFILQQRKKIQLLNLMLQKKIICRERTSVKVKGTHYLTKVNGQPIQRNEEKVFDLQPGNHRFTFQVKSPRLESFQEMNIKQREQLYYPESWW